MSKTINFTLSISIFLMLFMFVQTVKGNDEDHILMEKKILSNAENLLFPYIEKIKECKLNENLTSYVKKQGKKPANLPSVYLTMGINNTRTKPNISPLFLSDSLATIYTRKTYNLI